MNRSSSPITRIASIATRTVGIVEAQPLLYYSQRRYSSWTKQIIGGIALTSLSLSLIANGKAEAVSFTFEKIVDTNTSIPGGTGNFEFLSYSPR